MTIEKDDPRLTAYVLGELDEQDYAEVQAAISNSTELRRIVDEIRKTTDLLQNALSDEPAISLLADQRAAIEMAAEKPDGKAAEEIVVKRPWLMRLWFIPTGIAAVLLLGVTVRFLIPSLSAARRMGPRTAGNKSAPATEPLFASVDSAADSNATGALYTRISADFNGVPDFEQTAPNIDLKNQRQDSNQSVFQGGNERGAQMIRPEGYTLTTATLGNRVEAVADRAEVYPAHHVETEYLVRALGEIPLDELAQLRGGRDFNTEAYDRIVENPFLLATQNPLSTFSIDVDTASYANVRRFLTRDLLPPPGAVRIEELVNYFDYDYPLPTGDDPFSVNVEVSECPWNGEHLLARVGIKGREITPEERPPASLVFLIDVSGSMQSPNKLPLLVESMNMLVDQLAYDDSVAIVVYAGASGLVLPPTQCSNKGAIIDALSRLRAGGSTNGAGGIQLAYDTATGNFIEGGVNRVILATDGDFNVGLTNQGDLVRLIEEKAKSGVFLSVLGFGMGNYKDSTLEKLADRGNGNYSYIDTTNEAQKVLVEQIGGTLVTIAKDVKIQIEFNPAEVNAYRLIGYENRILQAQDFNDDKKDAGEIGAGHTVTALYEIVPAGIAVDVPNVDPLKYQTSPMDGRIARTDDSDATEFSGEVDSHGLKPAAQSGELMTVKLRYKQPDGHTSKLIEMPVTDADLTLDDMSDDFVFAASVAAFGMLLRGSSYSGDFTLGAALEMAEGSVGQDRYGYRTEFVSLVHKAMILKSPAP